MSTLKENKNATRRDHEKALAAYEYSRITFADLIFASNAADVAYNKWLDSLDDAAYEREVIA